jgi:hypothetical protein
MGCDKPRVGVLTKLPILAHKEKAMFTSLQSLWNRLVWSMGRLAAFGTAGRNSPRRRRRPLFLEPLEAKLALSATVAYTYRAINVDVTTNFSNTTTAQTQGGTYTDSSSGTVHVFGNVGFTSATQGSGQLNDHGSGQGHDNFGSYTLTYDGKINVTVNNGALSVTGLHPDVYTYSNGYTGQGGGYLGQVPTTGNFNPSTYEMKLTWDQTSGIYHVIGNASGTVQDKTDGGATTDLAVGGGVVGGNVVFTTNITGKFMHTSSMSTPPTFATIAWSSTPDLGGYLADAYAKPNIYWNNGKMTVTINGFSAPPTGAKYLVFDADPLNKIAESNENNNLAAVALSALPKTATNVALAATTPTVFGQKATLTATVTSAVAGAGTPTGTVTFFDGSVNIGTVALVSGKATLSRALGTVATHNLKATYNGSFGFAAKTSAIVPAVVNKAAATAVLTLPTGTLHANTNYVFKFDVGVRTPGAATPTGTVLFYDNGVPVSVRLSSSTPGKSSASLVYKFTTAGTHTLKILYQGDGHLNAASTLPVAITVVA